MLPTQYDSRTTIDTDQVCEYFGIAKNTVTTWVKQGRIPTPVRRGKTNVWRFMDIIACDDMMFQKAAKNVKNLKRA